MIPVEDIQASIIEAVADVVHDITASTDENKIRDWMKTWVAYAEDGPSFDPEGKYLCGTCAVRIKPDKCAPMSGQISFSTGSCRLYVHGPDVVETKPYPHQLTQIEAQYGEKPKTKAFGCTRCKYMSETSPDSEGRWLMCNYFGVHVKSLACCAMNESQDSIEAPGENKVIKSGEEKGWHGVDLDGTLAEYHGWKSETHIGKPIPKMVDKVKDWLANGEDVKIFTARATIKEAVKAIEEWCIKHIGQKLEVTNKKDFAMIDLWDDRAKEVEKNTGEIKAAQETSHEDGTLWNGILISGFTGPEEEGLRSMLSRVPPELLFNVSEIKSAKELNAKHGKFDPETKTILFNPHNWQLRQKVGKGDSKVNHIDLTIVHEVFHSIYNSLTPEQKQKWESLSGWQKGWKPGQSLAYEEKRPGWEQGTSVWTHRAGVKMPRYYTSKNPDEHFADCGAYVLLNKGFQVEPACKEFIDNIIKDHVKKYPQVSIESPIRANKETPNLYNNITAGGPGSGRHKEVEHEKPLSDRAKRALETYVPQSKEGRRISTLNELLVAKAVSGDHYGGTKPFDVIKGKVGIEVKTMLPIIPSKENRLNMKQSSIANKFAEAKRLGLKKVVTVGIDMRNNKYVVYVKEGLAGFRLGSMTNVGSLAGLKRFI
jgi:hypothetical protein